MAIRAAIVGSLLMVLLATPAPAVGQARAPGDPEEGSAIASDHAVQANSFRAMAASARAEMRLHKYMARTFHSGRKRAQLGARHCEKLVEQYRAIVEEYEALATLHDEAAAEGERR